MSRKRLPTPAGPAEIGVLDGLSYTLWLPDRAPDGGLVVLHGAGSCKENHHDMARAARAAGLAAVCFDMRGHGSSVGALDERIVADVATIAGLVPRPLALRGSSLGGWVAIAAARPVAADAVVAVCPAGSDDLLRGLRAGAFDFRADVPALERALGEHDPLDVVATLETPLMLLHAEGDERIPAEHSRRLHARSKSPLKRLVIVPGGHHRSVQHDAELQGEALRFVHEAFHRGRVPGARVRARSG